MQTTQLTFDDLCDRQPLLRTLYQEALAYPRKRGWNRLRTWYMSFKPRLSALVGWDARTDDQALTTPAAYDTAYHAVLDALESPRRKRRATR